MRHANEALDLTDEKVYAQEQVKAMRLGSKYSEALRAQRAEQLRVHVLVVLFYDEEQCKMYRLRDAATNLELFSDSCQGCANAWADEMNHKSDEDYNLWFKDFQQPQEPESMTDSQIASLEATMPSYNKPVTDGDNEEWHHPGCPRVKS